MDISDLIHREVDSQTIIPATVRIACKKLSATLTNSLSRRSFDEQVSCMEQIDHPQIVRVLGSHCSRECSVIMMKLMSGGSVFEAVNCCIKPSYDQRVCWIRQLLSGVQALHSKSLAHRDLKTANLLLSDDLECLKICDFGLAKIKDDTLSICTQKGEPSFVVGTRRHMAPELLNVKLRKPCLFAIDMYALGGCVEHILSGEVPHSHIREDVLFELLRRSPQDLVDADLPSNCPNKPGWDKFVASCRAVCPLSRPTIEQAQQAVSKIVNNQDQSEDPKQAEPEKSLQHIGRLGFLRTYTTTTKHPLVAILNQCHELCCQLENAGVWLHRSSFSLVAFLVLSPRPW